LSVRRPQSPRLPDFIGVGPGRTGTTWLDEVLRPHACLPHGVKETHFFSRCYERGIDWYAAHFRRCDESKPVGEICGYFSFPDAPARIRKHIPDCRIIVTARDPVERIYSHYKMMRRYAFTTRNLEDTLARDRFIAAGSRYGAHLPRWINAFGAERVLVAFHDDLRADPQGYVDAVADFIAVPRFRLSEQAIRAEAVHTFEGAPRSAKLARYGRRLRNWLRDRRATRAIEFLSRAGVWRVCFSGGEPYGPLPSELERRLREEFRADVEALERITGRDLTAWKSPRNERARTAAVSAHDVAVAAAER
jgi:hypothetical protein